MSESVSQRKCCGISHINGSKRHKDEQCDRADISIGKQHNPKFFRHVV